MAFAATIRIWIIKQAKAAGDPIGIATNQQCDNESKGSGNDAKRNNGHDRPSFFPAAHLPRRDDCDAFSLAGNAFPTQV